MLLERDLDRLRAGEIELPHGSRRVGPVGGDADECEIADRRRHGEIATTRPGTIEHGEPGVAPQHHLALLVCEPRLRLTAELDDRLGGALVEIVDPHHAVLAGRERERAVAAHLERLDHRRRGEAERHPGGACGSGDRTHLAPVLRGERLDHRDRERRVRIDHRARLAQRQLVVALLGELALELGRTLVLEGGVRGRIGTIARVGHPDVRDDASDDEREHREGDRDDRHPVLLHEAPQLLGRRVVVRGDELALDEAIEILGELARVLVPLVGIVLEGLVDDRRELRRHAVHQLADRRRWGVDGRLHHLVRGLRVVRRLAREQVIQGRAERVDIAARIDLLATELLGRHEAGCAVDDADPGLERVRGIHEHRHPGLLDLADDLREAPVDHDRLAEISDEDVRRLDVAVDDPSLVRVRDRLRRGHHVRDERAPLLDRLAGRDQRFERPAGDLAHHVERRPVRTDAAVVHRDDRGVLEPRGDPDLACEPLERVGVA